MIVAEVKFGSGIVHRCVGRVRNGQSAPWSSEADAEDHIRSVREKSGVDVQIIRFVGPRATLTKGEGENR